MFGSATLPLTKEQLMSGLELGYLFGMQEPPETPPFLVTNPSLKLNKANPKIYLCFRPYEQASYAKLNIDNPSENDFSGFYFTKTVTVTAELATQVLDSFTNEKELESCLELKGLYTFLLIEGGQGNRYRLHIYPNALEQSHGEFAPDGKNYEKAAVDLTGFGDMTPQRVKKQLTNCKQFRVRIRLIDKLYHVIVRPQEFFDSTLESKVQKTLSSDPTWQEARDYYEYFEDFEPVETHGSLEKLVRDFIPSKNKVLLLRGSHRDQNSLMVKYITLKLLNDDVPTSHVPIYVPLHKLKDPLCDLAQEGLRRLGIYDYKALYKEKLLWILDGYDQALVEYDCAPRIKNFYQTNELSEWKNSKFIFTCQEGFTDDTAFRPKAEPFLSKKLDPIQPILFIKFHLDRMPPEASNELWDVDSYRDFIERHQENDFWPIYANPFLLKLLVHQLPLLTKPLSYDSGTEGVELAEKIKELCACAIFKMHFTKMKQGSLEAFINYCIDLIQALHQLGKKKFTPEMIRSSPHVFDKNNDQFRKACLVYKNGYWECDPILYQWLETKRKNAKLAEIVSALLNSIEIMIPKALT